MASSTSVIRIRGPPSDPRIYERYTRWNEVEAAAMHIVKACDPAKSVVVLDIDATFLVNDNQSRTCDGARPHRGVQKIYKLALRRKIAVVFITARPDFPSNRSWTLRQLVCVGAQGAAALYMCPSNIRSVAGISTFKHNARKTAAEKLNRQIVLCVGDAWTDHTRVPSDAALNSLRGAADRGYWLFQSAEPHTDYCLKLPAER